MKVFKSKKILSLLLCFALLSLLFLLAAAPIYHNGYRCRDIHCEICLQLGQLTALFKSASNPMHTQFPALLGLWLSLCGVFLFSHNNQKTTLVTMKVRKNQ